MAETSGEILFETRQHASGNYISSYPPLRQQSSNDGGGRSFLSYLTPLGITQIKERWRKDTNRKNTRYAALFLSSHANYVAVSSMNQITFLHKDDNYKEPRGYFTSGSTGTFTCGAWSEPHDVLGVVNDSNTLFFIKANGEEITRISGQQLKVSLPILGLICRHDTDVENPCLCTFSILASDGLLHDIEISQDPTASFSASHLPHTGGMLKKRIPKNFSCMDYHPKSSFFAMVNNDVRSPYSKAEHPGSCCLSLWQRSNCSVLEPLVSIEFEGSYSEQKSYSGRLSSPKVLISPQGKFITTLDLTGCLCTFKFDRESCTLVKLYDGKAQDIDLMNDVVDCTWWSDDVIAVVERKGTFMLINVPTGVKLLENCPVYSMPILGTAKELSRCIFVLESAYSEKTSDKFEGNAINDLCLIEKLDFAKVRWSLFSLSEISVTEMYDLLMRKREYQVALGFADRHGLDKDEVLKSQWVSSGQGVNEINKLLSTIKDQSFVVSQCLNCVGPAEDAAKALLAYGLSLTDKYRFSEPEEDASSPVWDFRVARLRLLQFRDRLETFLGINMGRFSAQEYQKFRCSPINKAAMALAESGKIGALNLLFKRHPYSLSPFVLEVLDAIPETVPVQSYVHLLPGNSPPPSIAMREQDWVECDKMISHTNRVPENHGNGYQIGTELIIKQCMGFQWPSADSISLWYKNRARNIDTLSGQLENCLYLIDFACHKGIELQHFLEDISYLHQLIYVDDNIEEMDVSLSLSTWETLPDYEKFKLMLVGVRDENIIQRLQRNAIPFMQKRSLLASTNSSSEMATDSFLVRWLKEISLENKLELCLITVEEGCKNMESVDFFKDENEVMDCALQCIYLCSSIDRWSTMSSILSELSPLRGLGNENLKMQLKVAEGHVEAGRLLALYQVPKPINFFREAHNDEKTVKQIIRLILSKFIRRQLGRVDHEWTTLWHDLQSLQEKAFPFLELEYVLIEFCRGLLKAGKFSLARNYLKGTGSVVLALDKAENLVIQAAREYFYSAPSLDSPEVWKAKDCLNILPNSRIVRMEADVIDAITVKLPELGVKILPLQYRQMKDPLEIVKLAITSQAGAYLNVEELIEIAKLLGLTSHEDISAVQEAIAREAAVAGDLQLASDLCLVLAKKGHGSVWDLCAALARSQLENMDVSSRKFLLGFSLSHCDEESIHDLLNVWKDLDMQGQCENLIMQSGIEPPESLVLHNLTISHPLYSRQGTADSGIWSGKVGDGHDSELLLSGIKDKLSLVAKFLPGDNSNQLESLLTENGKILSFAALRLPWLLELANKKVSGKKYGSVRMKAVLTIMSWLVRNGFSPKDDLIASLAKSMMESPVAEDEDIQGCAFLLNLVDAFSGVGIIEGLVEERENYDEIASIMNVGLIYGLLHNRSVECEDAAQRKMLLFREFQQKHKSIALDENDELNKTQTAFWREWKMKLEQHKRAAEQSRVLEQIIPGVETARFLSGDTDYVESVLFSLIESVKMEKKHILADVLKLAEMYGVDHSKVLLKFMSAVFTSDVWAVDDIIADLSDFKDELISFAEDLIKVISLSVYPMIDGHDKHRLAYMYDLLSECYLKLEIEDMDRTRTRLSHLNKILGQECSRVSFISGLNFKRIAGLQDLNWSCFNDEVSSHITEDNVEALAIMVQNLTGIYGDTVPQDLLKWQYVYYCHVINLLATLKPKFDSEVHSPFLDDLQCLVTELELTYDVCRKYLKFIEYTDTLEIMKQFFSVTAQFEKPSNKLVDSIWLECLIKLLNVWLKMMMDMKELKSLQNSDKSLCSECLMMCVEVLLNLIEKGEVSQVEGWDTVIGFSKSSSHTGDPIADVSDFCRAMILAGCRYLAVANVFTDAMSHLSPGTPRDVKGLPHLYLTVLGEILSDLERGSLEQEHLHCFFSSLQIYKGNLEDLTHVRLAVWSKLSKFSEDLQLPGHVRVHILELMQRIATTGKLVKELSDELRELVPPWEGWENMQITSANQEKTSGDDDFADGANRLSSTLVALRSSQQLSAISPVLEIAPEDLVTVESAVACFLKISDSVQSESHIDALLAMLVEWEDLYLIERKVSDSPKVDDGGESSWSNDDWDEGWESFAEEEPNKMEVKSDIILSLHPLHSCWLDIFRKLSRFSRYLDILKLLDKYKGQSISLLDEDDSSNLIETLLELDHFAALKTASLLPYESLQLQCLEAVEQKLKQKIPDEVGRDIEFLLLLQSSGIISTVIGKSSLYGTTFSFICYMIGNLSRGYQEAKLSTLQHATTSIRDEGMFVFTRLVFPCFVAELVKCDQQILAGFLVTKLMHTNASLSLVNVAGSCLGSYLQKHLQLSDGSDESSWEDLNFPNTISILRGKLENVIHSALTLLPGQDR